MADRAEAPIDVTVVYALAEKQIIVHLRLAAGARVADAIAASGLAARFDLDPTALQSGVFGRRCDRSEPLADGDRVELYRPLLIDPKQRRRRQARD